MRLGTILRKWRTVNDYTVREVADKIGIAPSTLVHIEQGKTPPHSETLIALISWLIGDENGTSNGSDSPEQQPASAGPKRSRKTDAQPGE
jgi:transcriptional regulator with XRE-family HTH domain